MRRRQMRLALREISARRRIWRAAGAVMAGLAAGFSLYVLAAQRLETPLPFWTPDAQTNNFLIQLARGVTDGTSAHIPGTDITAYSENFKGETPGQGEKLVRGKGILWLGSTKNQGIGSLDKYLAILVSTPLLHIFFQAHGVKTFYFPTFAAAEILRQEPQYAAVIGNPPYIEDILQKKGIFYRKYFLDKPEAIRKDMPHFKAIFVEKTTLSPNQLDIHPLFLEAAAAKIPLATFWRWPDDDTINLFNDRVNFYMYYSDAARLADDILSGAPEPKQRAEKARKLVLREYSPARAAKRLNDALSGTPQTAAEIPFAGSAEPEKGSINIDLPIAVGHYGAGDYWLAKDLAAYLEDNGAETDLTFFNSLYKYRTESNILIRGFIPPAETDTKADINILYLAYAQFPQNDKREIILPNQAYITALAAAGEKVDAIATASESLTTALKKRGIKAYYIPQFTNPSRFYPDYDEKLKSEVFFVGLNTFYRKAAHILLKHGLPITIYGPAWPEGTAKGNYLDNRVLRKYYSSAKIVLNDTREGMKQFGFISNRIYDATASGTLVISDYMPEIEAIYGDTVPMWKNEEELVRLVKYYLDPAHEDERLDKARRARKITLKSFTNDRAAAKFLEIIRSVKQDKGL